MKKRVGLALGGGGAWSITGLGVIRKLEENGIKIDFLAGCSMGALIAAAYSSSFDSEDNLQKIENIVSRMKLRHGVSISHHQYGLFSPEKIGRGFEEKFGKFNFEDLKIPLSVVATDFKTGEAVIFDKGPLTPALTASASFPIIFTPYNYQDRLLSDGGLSIPTPVGVVRKMGADIVIGIDVTSKKHLKRLNQSPSWHHKIIRFIPPLHYALGRHPRKTTAQLIDLLLTNLNRSQILQSPPDFLLTPEITHFDQFSFHQAKQFIKEGERVTEEIIPELKKLLS